MNDCFLLQTSDSKMIAAKCECSSDGDYVGVFFVSRCLSTGPHCIQGFITNSLYYNKFHGFTDTLTQSGWLEVHKIPKDVWHRELENLVSAAFAKKQKAEEESVVSIIPFLGAFIELQSVIIIFRLIPRMRTLLQLEKRKQRHQGGVRLVFFALEVKCRSQLKYFMAMFTCCMPLLLDTFTEEYI